MAGGTTSLHSPPAEPAKSAEQSKLAPVFAASGASKRAREIPVHGNTMPGESIEIATITDTLQSEEGSIKKAKTEIAATVHSNGSASLAATTSVATTNTATVTATQSEPEVKSA